MRSTIYWVAVNTAIYLLLWLLNVVFTCGCPATREYGAYWTGELDFWPIRAVPWIIIVMAAVNLLVFAAARPLGEDCDKS